MKIALSQLNYRIGDFEYNTSLIRENIVKARSGKADVVIFAELAVCGYPPRDFLEFDDFIARCRKSLAEIAQECFGIAAIVGCPSRNPADKGKPLYNTAFFLAEGKIIGQTHKCLLPNYDIFDEYRYFEPDQLPSSIVEYGGKRFALTICEDLWGITDNPLYVRNPMEELIGLNPDLIINIAASPFHYDQQRIRREILTWNARTYGLPLFYVNHVGGQTELIFDGNSMLVNAKGEVVKVMKQFEEDFVIFDCDQVMKPRSHKDTGQPCEKVFKHPARSNPVPFNSLQISPLIHDALILGIRDYFHKMGFSKAILGLSGGIDSAITLVLAARALGKENVRSVLLPSMFSSEHSITDAVRLTENLGTGHEIISIDEIFQCTKNTLNPQFRGLPSDLTEENIQARIRGLILMALSNKFGHILLNTSNKSEAAVGYGTLYGDMSGGLSVLGDVYKTQIYALAAYINHEREIIPENIIRKPPSAELRPNQKDSDSLPEYAILDQILYRYIELRKGPDEIIREGFDETTVRRVLKLVNTSEYKRSQTPPILRISPKAFGMGRRIPIVAKYLS